MFKKMQNRKGFTLIEMMAVIAIVAILVAIVVPIVNNSQIKARASVDAANLRSMAATVATRYVSTTDPNELLSDLEAPDSELVENSNVIFYVVDGKEMLAYYCTSLLFPEHLRGTGYNGLVAISGDINEPYDTLPKGAVRLCALTASGQSFDDARLTEISDLASKYGDVLTDVRDNLYNTTDSERGQQISGTANLIANAGAAIKVSLIDALVNKYGYTYPEALDLVNSGGFTAGMVDTIPNLTTEQKEDMTETLTQIQNNTKIRYDACAHYHCATVGLTQNHLYSNNTRGDNSEFLAYCQQYGLEPVYNNWFHRH